MLWASMKTLKLCIVNQRLNYVVRLHSLLSTSTVVRARIKYPDMKAVKSSEPDLAMAESRIKHDALLPLLVSGQTPSDIVLRSF